MVPFSLQPPPQKKADGASIDLQAYVCDMETAARRQRLLRWLDFENFDEVILISILSFVFNFNVVIFIFCHFYIYFLSVVF